MTKSVKLDPIPIKTNNHMGMIGFLCSSKGRGGLLVKFKHISVSSNRTKYS